MDINKEFRQFIRGAKELLPVLLLAITIVMVATIFPWVGIAFFLLVALCLIYKLGEKY